MTKINIKKGDTVLVICGKDKGKTGKVVSVDIKNKKAIVEGVNMYKKHAKPSKKYPQGGIIDLMTPIEISNLSLICPGCNKKTKVQIKKSKDSHSRICKKCNEVINGK